MICKYWNTRNTHTHWETHATHSHTMCISLILKNKTIVRKCDLASEAGKIIWWWKIIVFTEFVSDKTLSEKGNVKEWSYFPPFIVRKSFQPSRSIESRLFCWKLNKGQLDCPVYWKLWKWNKMYFDTNVGRVWRFCCCRRKRN